MLINFFLRKYMEKLCQEGTSAEDFRKALDENKVSLDEIFGNDKITALMWAAKEGKIEIASLLTKRGASMDTKDKDGESEDMI